MPALPRSRRRSSALLLICALAGAVSTTTANARADGEAAAEFALAVRAAEAQDLVNAARHFERAQQLQPHAHTLYNLTVVLDQLGEHTRVVELVGQYLEEHGAQLADEERSALDGQLDQARRHLAKVALRVEPPNANITFDGGKTAPDAVVWCEPGAHRIEVSQAGYRPYVTTLDTFAGQVSSLHVALSLQPKTPEAAIERLPTLRPSETTNEETAIEPSTDRGMDEQLTAVRWSTAAGSAALVASAIGIVIWGNERTNDWEAKGRELESAPSLAAYEEGRASQRELANSIRLWDGVSWGLLAGGVLLGTASVWLWSLPSSPSNTTARISASGREVVFTMDF